mgnify:CR=1 FL=1
MRQVSHMGLVALRGAFEVGVTLIHRGLMLSKMCMPLWAIFNQ